ncbi:bifunctional diguanylate cyclase/phosphodiesterase [Vibrio mangrovi]|uniref:Cache domain-containing protein n=1 Tax=Vibrio mangrovi TaxID=474394 RepID=A0A1Y6J414_9VIBR|nr:cache domain-containing protein [Vibrio mangrovi]MDW6005331.1 cache domain-containing protein [Vibrio mangrovi]SMS03043.1 Cyclic di-GMP phosphodiesterase Gmr [Vibrio mangrovi]
MLKLDNKKLLHIIRYAPVIVVTLFAIAVNIIAIEDNQSMAQYSIENLRAELLNTQREKIREQVRYVIRKVRTERFLSEAKLKDHAKQRVYEAYHVAHYIYNSNQGKPKAEIVHLITDALRPLHFFNERGYFFIFTQQGISVMNGLRPELEGTSILDLQDSRGTYFIRNFIKKFEHSQEGFYQWWFQKPGQSNQQDFQKIGFAKTFEPYHWYIGTGEYVTAFENALKKEILEWISEYEYGEGGYFFIIDKQGTLLAHHYNDFLGPELTVGKKIDDSLRQQILAQVRNGGGYIRYQKPLTVDGKISLEQVSYVTEIKGWDWIVGTGFYSQVYEKYLSSQAHQLSQYKKQSLAKLSTLGIVSILLLIVVSLYVSHLIARRFNTFQQRIVDDVNELENSKDKMEFMALHDALTGLPNRLSLQKKIQESINLSKKHGTHAAIMFVDLDDFKHINDLHGHATGDQLLCSISRQFESVLEETDLVARFGGDEFIFCCADLQGTDEAREKAEIIRRLFDEQFVIGGKILSVGCSIGISMYPDDSDDPAALIRKADIVLYHSKAIKKGQILFYDQHINEQVQLDLNIHHELQRALINQEFSVCYQPQIEANRHRLVSVEALIRWNNPRLGNVPPAKFIETAEETGLIHDIGLFVFRRACEEIYRLSPNGHNAVQLSVNVSPTQLVTPHFPEQLAEICSEIGIHTHRITLEITENILINKLETAIPILNQLRVHGFGISLDDFGTGYSSLSYINNLPLTEIKIDRCFIDRMLNNQQSNMLVKMIIGIGKFSGMTVVAEGVETQEQYEQLIEYHCDLVQGFYFDRPLTFEQLTHRYKNYYSAYVNNFPYSY